MTDDIHADRRDPRTPDGAFDLRGAADELLEQARQQAAGRAARTLTPGAGALLKQTLLALTAGQRLDDHTAPGPATLQVLTGEVTIGSGTQELQVAEQHWATIPAELHDLRAATDAVVLLTVALPSGDADDAPASHQP